MNICDQYVGVSCIDGSCPIANEYKYAERAYDLILSCSDCPRRKGCEDCYLLGNFCNGPREGD